MIRAIKRYDGKWEITPESSGVLYPTTVRGTEELPTGVALAITLIAMGQTGMQGEHFGVKVGADEYELEDRCLSCHTFSVI